MYEEETNLLVPLLTPLFLAGQYKITTAFLGAFEKKSELLCHTFMRLPEEIQ
jgi:hypothetical protein